MKYIIGANKLSKLLREAFEHGKHDMWYLSFDEWCQKELAKLQRVE